MAIVVFWIAALVAVAAAVSVITQRKPVNSVLSLVVVLFALAVLYIQLSAEFIAALQIIIYAGAIMVLFLFVVMLLNLRQDQFTTDDRPGVLALGTVFGGSLLLELLIVMQWLGVRASGPEGYPVHVDFGSVRQIGHLLFSEYLLPFELTSILLLITVAGALVLARPKTDEPPEEEGA